MTPCQFQLPKGWHPNTQTLLPIVRRALNLYGMSGTRERASISNRSTIGVMLSGCKVETCLIGAPAWAASMQCGDIIEQVDGTAVSSATVQGALKGSDEPGSAVKLTVRRKSGESILLVLHRMASEQVADKRRLFELFTAIKDAASKPCVLREDGFAVEDCQTDMKRD